MITIHERYQGLFKVLRIVISGNGSKNFLCSPLKGSIPPLGDSTGQGFQVEDDWTGYGCFGLDGKAVEYLLGFVAPLEWLHVAVLSTLYKLRCFPHI